MCICINRYMGRYIIVEVNVQTNKSVYMIYVWMWSPLPMIHTAVLVDRSSIIFCLCLLSIRHKRHRNVRQLILLIRVMSQPPESQDGCCLPFCVGCLPIQCRKQQSLSQPEESTPETPFTCLLSVRNRKIARNPVPMTRTSFDS